MTNTGLDLKVTSFCKLLSIRHPQIIHLGHEQQKSEYTFIKLKKLRSAAEGPGTTGHILVAQRCTTCGHMAACGLRPSTCNLKYLRPSTCNLKYKTWRPCWRILKQTNARLENQSTRCVTIWTVMSQRVIE